MKTVPGDGTCWVCARELTKVQEKFQEYAKLDAEPKTKVVSVDTESVEVELCAVCASLTPDLTK